MVISAATVTRRSALGLGLLAAAACKHDSGSPARRTGPDSAALASARIAEQAIIAACDAAGLHAESAIHAEHFRALGGSATTPPGLTPPHSSMRTLLDESAAAFRDAAVAAVDGTHAATLASISACHQVMAT